MASNGTPTSSEAQIKIKSLVLTSTGSSSDYSNLQVKDEDYPKIEKDDDVIVRIKAVGLNFAELMQRQGLYKPSVKTPYTPGFEGAGIVEKLSDKITDLKVNDRVMVFNSHNIWKEVVVLPRHFVVKIPDEMSFEEAAGIFVNYMTAYHILFRMACIKPGDSVLIHMAAGGVGTAASQLCKTVPGVTVFGTASAAKHDIIREYGVDHPIDYTSKDYVEEIKKISPEGVDVVMDPLNGENSIKGYSLLKPLGKIIHFGAASMTSESRSLIGAFKTWWKCLSLNSLDIMSDNKMIGGYHLGVLVKNPEFAKKTIETDLKAIIQLFLDKKIKIKIDSTYSYSRIGDAMKRMHTRQNIGKVILKPDSEFQPVTQEQVEITTVVTTTTVTPTKIETVGTQITSLPTAETTTTSEATVPTKQTNENNTESSQEEPTKTETEPVKTETENKEETKPTEQTAPISA